MTPELANSGSSLHPRICGSFRKLRPLGIRHSVANRKCGTLLHHPKFCSPETYAQLSNIPFDQNCRHLCFDFVYQFLEKICSSSFCLLLFWSNVYGCRVCGFPLLNTLFLGSFFMYFCIGYAKSLADWVFFNVEIIVNSLPQHIMYTIMTGALMSYFLSSHSNYMIIFQTTIVNDNKNDDSKSSFPNQERHNSHPMTVGKKYGHYLNTFKNYFYHIYCKIRKLAGYRSF